MAFWPALLLARSERLPWALRGLLAGGAVLLAEVALLSQSRGSLYATPVMLVLVFALLPGRMRTFALLRARRRRRSPRPRRSVLRVGDHLQRRRASRPAPSTTRPPRSCSPPSAVVARSSRSARRSRRAATLPAARAPGCAAAAAVAALAVLALLVGLGGRARGAPATPSRASNSALAQLQGRLRRQQLRSRQPARQRARQQPLRLLPGRARRIPRPPARWASAPTTSSSSTCCTAAATRRRATRTASSCARSRRRASSAPCSRSWASPRRCSPPRAPRAAPIRSPGRSRPPRSAGFAYWVVHGSFDWFWEFAGLGAPAFALLGLACALAPAERHRRSAASQRRGSLPAAATRLGAAPARRRPAGAGRSRCRSRRRGSSQLQVQSAARIWTQRAAAAYARLRTPPSLNPLSDEAYLVAGSIALRFGDLARADRQFALRARAHPRRRLRDARARRDRLERRGTRAGALALLERAVALNPRDALALEALRTGAARRSVSTSSELNRAILLKAQQLCLSVSKLSRKTGSFQPRHDRSSFASVCGEPRRFVDSPGLIAQAVRRSRVDRQRTMAWRQGSNRSGRGSRNPRQGRMTRHHRASPRYVTLLALCRCARASARRRQLAAERLRRARAGQPGDPRRQRCSAGPAAARAAARGPALPAGSATSTGSVSGRQARGRAARRARHSVPRHTPGRAARQRDRAGVIRAERSRVRRFAAAAASRAALTSSAGARSLRRRPLLHTARARRARADRASLTAAARAPARAGKCTRLKGCAAAARVTNVGTGNSAASWTERESPSRPPRTIALRGELTHDAPWPRALRADALPRPAAVGARGSRLGRPAPDRRLRPALRSPSWSRSAASAPRCTSRASSAPLLALPPLVLLLFYLRGLYRTRLRALVLDGVVPVLSAVSVGAMAVAVLGMFLNDQVAQPERLAARLAVRADRRRPRPRAALPRPALGARAPAGRQAGADHGRRRGRRAGRAPPGEPPRVRARADRLPRRGPALGRRGGRARRAGARHDRGPRRDRRSAPASGT